MALVDIGSTGPTDTSTSIPATTSSVPANVTINLPYFNWTPNPTPFDRLADGSHLFKCLSRTSAGDLRNAYTMNIRTAYTFDAAQLPTNQSAMAFELQGVLYAQGFGEDSDLPVFADDIRRQALLNGSAIDPSSWDVDYGQRCVRVTWTVDVAPSVRGGTFQLASNPPNMGLYVQSAVLLAVRESTNQVDTLSGDLTSATQSPLPASTKSSSSPNLGVIIPAILVPILVISGAIVAFVFWRNRQQRRRRLAPSAAFRQDHAATIARGVEGGGRGASPVPSNANAYIPLDDKRAFNFST